MGQSISDLRKQATSQQAEAKQEFQERLQILEKMIEQRLETQKFDILNGEKNDQEIDTGTIVSLHKMVYIKMAEGESEDMKKTIHQLFSGDFIGGLESIVELGAETVLGNDSMESTRQQICLSCGAKMLCFVVMRIITGGISCPNQ